MCHLLTPRRPRTRLDNSETGAAARGPARPGLSSVVFYRFVGRGRPPDTTTPALLLRPLPPSRAFSFQFIFEDLTTLSNHSSRPGSEERLHSLTHGRDTPRPRRHTHTHKYKSNKKSPPTHAWRGGRRRRSGRRRTATASDPPRARRRWRWAGWAAAVRVTAVRRGLGAAGGGALSQSPGTCARARRWTVVRRVRGELAAGRSGTSRQGGVAAGVASAHLAASM